MSLCMARRRWYRGEKGQNMNRLLEVIVVHFFRHFHSSPAQFCAQRWINWPFRWRKWLLDSASVYGRISKYYIHERRSAGYFQIIIAARTMPLLPIVTVAKNNFHINELPIFVLFLVRTFCPRNSEKYCTFFFSFFDSGRNEYVLHLVWLYLNPLWTSITLSVMLLSEMYHPPESIGNRIAFLLREMCYCLTNCQAKKKFDHASRHCR